MTALAVALGGALGALARHGLGSWVQSLTRSPFPLGTFTVNILGCFALGLALAWFDARTASVAMRRFVTVGLLGAFTTFSTFSWETSVLMQERMWIRASIYAAGSLVLGLMAIVVGVALGESLTSS